MPVGKNLRISCSDADKSRANRAAGALRSFYVIIIVVIITIATCKYYFLLRSVSPTFPRFSQFLSFFFFFLAILSTEDWLSLFSSREAELGLEKNFAELTALLSCKEVLIFFKLFILRVRFRAELNEEASDLSLAVDFFLILSQLLEEWRSLCRSVGNREAEEHLSRDVWLDIECNLTSSEDASF